MVQDKVAVTPRLENANAREKSVVLSKTTDVNRVAVDALQDDLRIVFNGIAVFLVTVVLNPLKPPSNRMRASTLGLEFFTLRNAAVPFGSSRAMSITPLEDSALASTKTSA